MKIIAFTAVRLPFGWLGNMAPFSVHFEGERYRTTEALFQAMRFSDESIKALIREQKSPMAAKLVAKGKASQMTVEQLSEKDVANMMTCIRLKVEQNPTLIDELLATGDAMIVEDVTKRGDKGSNLFWGARLVNGTWEGKNILGNLWMNLRQEYANALANEEKK